MARVPHDEGEITPKVLERCETPTPIRRPNDGRVDPAPAALAVADPSGTPPEAVEQFSPVGQSAV